MNLIPHRLRSQQGFDGSELESGHGNSAPHRKSKAQDPHWLRIYLLLCEWVLRQRTRAQLGKLDARMLDDVGLNAEQATSEKAKAFWQK